MASLTQLSRELDEHSTLTRRLFSAFEQLAGGQVQASETGEDGKTVPLNPEDLIKSLVALDGRLQKAADEVEKHQRWHRRLEAVEEDIGKCDTAIAALATHIYDAQGKILSVLDQAEKRTEEGEGKAVLVEDILEYGKRLANFTAAPPGYDPNVNTGAGTMARPPFPSEHQMKAGWMRGAAITTVDETAEGHEHDAMDEGGDGVVGEEEEEEEDHDIFDLDLNPDE